MSSVFYIKLSAHSPSTTNKPMNAYMAGKVGRKRMVSGKTVCLYPLPCRPNDR
jgi:hypothetical protein